MLIWIERLCLVCGTALMLAVGGNALYSHAAADRAVSKFSAQRELQIPPPDTGLWSRARKIAYRSIDARDAMAVLHIPAHQVTVPVLEGADEATLNLGAGWLPGTAAPGQPGNVAIAAHRDGYFRALKDIRVGDELTVQTPTDDHVYRVEWTRVVEPDAVYVLKPTPSAVLTLITCYPFYFVGSAPQRFIVRARLISTRPYSFNQKL